MPTQAKKKKASVKDAYRIVITMPSNSVEAVGKTADEALNNLDMSFMDVKEKGTITLYKGSKKSERFFYKNALKKVVVNKLRKAQVGRDLESLLQ